MAELQFKSSNQTRALEFRGDGEIQSYFGSVPARETVVIGERSSQSLELFDHGKSATTGTTLKVDRTLVSALSTSVETAIPNLDSVPEVHSQRMTTTAALRSTLDGVVSNVTDQQVDIECFTDHGSIHLMFPKTMVPDDLARYGRPVSIAMETINGFKTPSFRPRVVEDAPLQDEFQELLRWAEALPDD